MQDPTPSPTVAELAREFDDLEPWGYGAVDEVPIFVFGIMLAVPALAMLVLIATWVRHRARAAIAAKVEAGAVVAAPVAGFAVLHGTVVDVEGGDDAVRVSVVQQGSEQKNKGSWRTTWTETRRETETHPFHLQLASGDRVRVEPGPAPQLLDDLTHWTRVDLHIRRCIARLQPGEKVFAEGVIATAPVAGGGYRGGSALVLRGRPGKPLLLSTDPLSFPHRRAAGYASTWALWLAAATLAVQLMATPYHVSRWFGETRPATIVQRWTHEVKRKKSVETVYTVRYRVDGSEALVQEQVEEDTYPRLTEGRRIPVRVSPLETTIGPHPTYTGLLALPAIPFILVMTLVALIGAFVKRGWTRTRLDQTESGRLAESHPLPP